MIAKWYCCLFMFRNGRLQGVRSWDLWCIGQKETTKDGKDYQRRASRLLVTDFRPKLRRPSSDILRHVLRPFSSSSQHKIIPSLIHMFFFRADSNADGRITRKEVQEVRLINLFQSHYSLWAGHPWMKAMFSSYKLNHLMASLENFIHHKWTATISILICH